MSTPKRLGLAFVFLWFFLGGVAHFAATDLELSIVPSYIPWPRAAVLVSGVFELLGAAGLLYGPARSAAGMGLFALTIAVTPANFFMLQRPDLFHVPLLGTGTPNAGAGGSAGVDLLECNPAGDV